MDVVTAWLWPLQLVGPDRLGAQPDVRTYFDGMSACDRVARRQGGCDTLEGYLSSVVARLHPVDDAQLRRCVRHAAALISRSAAQSPAHGALAALGRRVPWRVAVLEDRAEDGWPHTHGDVVCLPRRLLRAHDRALVETLVHERVHVLQRARPDVAAAVVVGEWGLVPHDRATVLLQNPGVAERVRSNPDLDDKLYSFPGDDVVPLSVFVEGEAQAAVGGLRAARVALIPVAPAGAGAALLPLASAGASGRRREHAYEHPFEAMAYTMASAICGTSRSQDFRR